MSADRPSSADLQLTRIVRSWLRTDEHESADRVLDAVLATLDATPQRRASWPARRIADVNTYVKLALALAAVVVVAVVGVDMLPSGGAPAVGGPVVTTPSPSVSPSPSPSSGALDLPAVGGLEAGTRYRSESEGVAFTFAVPTADWYNSIAWLNKGFAPSNGMQLSFFGGGRGAPAIFTDPCAHTGLREFDDSVLGAATAIAALDGVEVVEPPMEYSVDTHRAVTVAIRVPSDIGCASSEYWLSYAPCAKVDCTEYPTWLDSTLRYWFVDMGGGRRFQIRAESRSSDAGSEAEFQQIVDSIRFEGG